MAFSTPSLSCCFYVKSHKNMKDMTWDHSIHVWLLCQCSFSVPSTKELHGSYSNRLWPTGTIGMLENTRRSAVQSILKIWAIAGFFLVKFCLFNRTNKCEKHPSSIWCLDSNLQPLYYKSPYLTIRPRAPALQAIVWHKSLDEIVIFYCNLE